MFNVYDRFGRVMKENLNRRGCEILSTSRFRSVSEIRDHVTQLLPSRSVDGGSGPVVKAVDMDTYYSKYITAIEKFRIEQLELFDEMEEWRLIQEHYFVLALTNMRGIELLRECAMPRPRFRTEELYDCHPMDNQGTNFPGVNRNRPLYNGERVARTSGTQRKAPSSYHGSLSTPPSYCSVVVTPPPGNKPSAYTPRKGFPPCHGNHDDRDPALEYPTGEDPRIEHGGTAQRRPIDRDTVLLRAAEQIYSLGDSVVGVETLRSKGINRWIHTVPSNKFFSAPNLRPNTQSGSEISIADEAVRKPFLSGLDEGDENMRNLSLGDFLKNHQ